MRFSIPCAETDVRRKNRGLHGDQFVNPCDPLLDAIDGKIVTALQRSGRASNVELAAEFICPHRSASGGLARSRSAA